jgi:hypothetical protein
LIRTSIQFFLVLVAVVVVLGFVQATGDRADERTALQMILADLETDSVELTAQLNRGHTTERAVLWILRNLDREPPVDSVIRGLSPLYYYTAYEQVRAGYLNLLYAGRLTVIRNPELRQGVVAYFERTHPYMWQFYAMYMDIYREFKETTAPYIRFVPEPEGEVLAQNFHVEMVRPWAEMKADTDFLYKMEELGGTGSQFGVRLGPALERNAELRVAIRQELGLE